MNRPKEPVIQRPSPNNFRIISEENPLPKPKKIFKLNSRGEAPSPKNSPLKDHEAFFSRPGPVKLKISRQNVHRAQSVEKLPPPQSNDVKNKVITNTKVPSRDSGVSRQPNKPVKAKEGDGREHAVSKSASPNKERAVRELPKVKENAIARKDTLEVVSEENEEHFRETLQGLSRRDSDNQNKKPESPKKIQFPGSVEVAFDEYSLNKGRNMMQKKIGEDGSPKGYKQELDIDNMFTRQRGESFKRENEPETPTKSGSGSIVRGKFTKEHVLPEVRQKEQDQKKLMKEYLDSQLDEKRRLKEEEKLRQIEEDKKEEARLKREMSQLNKQYERELLNAGNKISRQTDPRTESPLKELRTKMSVKRDSPEVKAQERESVNVSELGYGSKQSQKYKTLKDESALRKEIEKLVEFNDHGGHGNLKKLEEENEELRNQNLRKNELIDILITALKNTNQDGPISADHLRYTPGFTQTRTKSRTVHDRAARTTENLDSSPLLKKQDSLFNERNNTSPWSTAGGTYYGGLRSETDPDMTSEEPLSPVSTGPRADTFRTSETLGKLISPTAAYTELKLPAIPDFYSHRKGQSALLEQNISMKAPPTILSRSNMQTIENNVTIVSQSSSRMMSTPFNSKISPRPFSLNISSPSSAMILKPKNEIMTTSVTPTLYSRQITHYGRNKLEGNSPDVDMMTMGGRSTVEIDSQRVITSITSLSQLSVRKGKDNLAFQVPSSPFRNSTNVHQRNIIDARSPIRVVDMGNGQQTTPNRELKSIQPYPLMKEREPRFKDELISMRDGVKSVRSLDQYLEKGDIELEGDIKRMEQWRNKSKFPKEVFYLNLRKKVGA